MDLKQLASVFSLVFIAELGDKTQIATMGLVASGWPKTTVFVGAGAALLATTALGVLFGEAAVRLVSPLWMKRIAGIGFLILGVLFLSGRA